MFLEVDSLTKAFGAVQALGGVSFGCDRGRLVSLLGPSGCGKTTTLRILAGFDTADSGSLRLDGESLDGQTPEARRVGIVVQNYALFPHMSVGQNIAYGLRFKREGRSRGMSAAKRRARVGELLEMMDLSGYEGRRPDQLSAGQQQRVAIARVLAPEPRLVLFDEPLSALDASLREHLRLEIRRIQRELGFTAVYVTHDQEEAMAISDRIVIIRDGLVEQEGSPCEIYEQPASRFVATFVGRTSLIPADRLPGHPPQSPGVAVLRAERLSPQPIGAGSLTGRLVEVEYLGNIVRLHVRTGTGTVWAAIPGTSFSEWIGRRDEEITLYFDPDQTPVLP